MRSNIKINNTHVYIIRYIYIFTQISSVRKPRWIIKRKRDYNIWNTVLFYTAPFNTFYNIHLLLSLVFNVFKYIRFHLFQFHMNIHSISRCNEQPLTNAKEVLLLSYKYILSGIHVVLIIHIEIQVCGNIEFFWMIKTGWQKDFLFNTQSNERYSVEHAVIWKYEFKLTTWFDDFVFCINTWCCEYLLCWDGIMPDDCFNLRALVIIPRL